MNATMTAMAMTATTIARKTATATSRESGNGSGGGARSTDGRGVSAFYSRRHIFSKSRKIFSMERKSGADASWRPGHKPLKTFDDFEKVPVGAGEVHRVELVVVVYVCRIPGTAVLQRHPVRHRRPAAGTMAVLDQRRQEMHAFVGRLPERVEGGGALAVQAVVALLERQVCVGLHTRKIAGGGIE